MRRAAVLATTSLSVLLSLALGTSAVALREEPVSTRAAARSDQGGGTMSRGERRAPLANLTTATAAGAQRVADDGNGPTSPRPDPAPGGPTTSTTSAGSAAAPAPGTPAPAAAPAPAAPDCAVQACVALTFDDGPGPDTNRLLDELAARAVHATFFVVGREIAREPGVVAREVAAGHVVGNHTWDHAALPGLSPDAVSAELDATDAALVAAGAPMPSLARPPYGSTSALVTQAYAARGLVGVLWDVDTEDWKNRDAVVTTQRALDGAHPGAVILMHDIRPSTVDAVPGLVDALRARGFTLVTVPELLAGAVPGGMYSHR